MECWLCRDSGVDSHTGAIIDSLCKCKGSIGSVHQRCIVDCTRYKTKDRFNCSVCLQKYDSQKIRTAYKHAGMYIEKEKGKKEKEEEGLTVRGFIIFVMGWILFCSFVSLRVSKLDSMFKDYAVYQNLILSVNCAFYMFVARTMYLDNRRLAILVFTFQTVNYFL